MLLPRSLLAITLALLAALGLQMLFGQISLLVVAAGLSNSSFAPVLGSTLYALQFASVAVGAGLVLGALVSARPMAHVLALGVMSPAIGYAVSGRDALPHGWQIANYLAQLAFIGIVARTAYRRNDTLARGRPNER